MKKKTLCEQSSGGSMTIHCVLYVVIYLINALFTARIATFWQ